ncbi:hypothetical protein DFR58_113132 [Anaerobacterium chartisolvens]|uniref:Uncharacterized protein n=1 Tax=Anaerobacterium chartisolvens TaxID=1297424 RepID=A0A369B1W4_9FIRM|nr:hypothetical protein DFR58_113132 [Anaerobacterium chartisolvens]
MYPIKQAFVGKENKIVYEKNVLLKSKYKFKSKNIFLDFIDKLVSTSISEFLHTFQSEILNEFGEIKTNTYQDFKNIINNSQNIYRINAEITGEDSEVTHCIVAKFSELESYRSKSFIKIISTDKEWITTAENMILENLSLYKNSLSFLSNNFIKITLATILFTIVFVKMFGLDFLEKLNPTNFIILMIYCTIFIFIVDILEYLLIPTFKISAKAGFVKRLLLRIKQDSFSNTIAIISLIVGIVGVLIGILK